MSNRKKMSTSSNLAWPCWRKARCLVISRRSDTASDHLPNRVRILRILEDKSSFEFFPSARGLFKYFTCEPAAPNWPLSAFAVMQQFGRWGNRPASLWIAEDFGCCASG